MADAIQANSAPGRSGSSALHKSLNALLKAAEIILGGNPAPLTGRRSAPEPNAQSNTGVRAPERNSDEKKIAGRETPNIA